MMKMTGKAFAKKLFGAKYERLPRTLFMDVGRLYGFYKDRIASGGCTGRFCLEAGRDHGNGKGIQKEFADRIFERLYTMEDSRNREVQGNGLGLTIAKNLAVQLGGDICVESIPGIRTTFTVKLKKINY